MKIINLKHAWEFILDKDVITSPTNYYVSQYIARLINEGFFYDGGRIRQVPVNIGASTYKPPIPIENVVRERIVDIINSDLDDIDKAINLTLFVMKTQVFIDGNKRTAIIFANHYLISHALGLIVIPSDLVSEYKKVLISYYEDDLKKDDISLFLKEKCWIKI
jgi:prophage maintenance system killer protein